jgi:hypothetical protein
MAYAGYPLLADARAIGVLAMFSRAAIRHDILETLRTTADVIAQTVRTRLHESTYRGDVSVSENKRLDSFAGSRAARDRPTTLPRSSGWRICRSSVSGTRS